METELENLKREKELEARLKEERVQSNRAYAEKRVQNIVYSILVLIFLGSVSFFLQYFLHKETATMSQEINP